MGILMKSWCLCLTQLTQNLKYPYLRRPQVSTLEALQIRNFNHTRSSKRFFCVRNINLQNSRPILEKDRRRNLPRVTVTHVVTTRWCSHQVVPHLKTMKLDTPEFYALFTPELKVLRDIFTKYNYELRIAGGAVRDLLMGKEPHDLDFATTATPSEMKMFFEKEGIRMINTKGEKHGTITCRINDKENFEVTTLRIDVVTDGRHAEVEFTRDWQLDALRRDLTINSMFLGFDGTVHDYFSGIEDLHNRKVAFVGNAADRIQEDYLRILRYFRFYGRISEHENAHDAKTLDAIRANMKGLKGISGERIWVELKKIITGGHAAAVIRVMFELNATEYIGLPAKCNVDEFERVWTECHDLNPKPLTLLPALLSYEDEVYKFNERMKMSRDEQRLGVFIIHHRNEDWGPHPLRWCQDMLCDLKESSAKDRICEFLKYRNQRKTLEEFSAWQLPRFPVSGHSLLAAGVPKGPALAKTLTALREKWKESCYTYTEEQLLEFLDDLKKEIK